MTSDGAMQPPDGSETAAANVPGSLRFRVLRRGDWRRAFRLEQAFWTTLEEEARLQGRKLADHVRHILENAPAIEGGNDSSLLRVHAVRWLDEKLRRLEQRQERREVLHAALAAPLPCFVISANRALVTYNAEFSAYVTGRAQAASDEDVSKARLTLDVPVDRLIDVLRDPPGRVVMCGFSIRTSAAIASGRARVTLAQPSRTDLVVGYIVPG
ncbi:ribbon-helix-helix domain-containing protein [Alsobacter sp. R-9]